VVTLSNIGAEMSELFQDNSPHEGGRDDRVPGLSVLVVAGDPLARAGLARSLAQAGCRVAGQSAGDEDLLAEANVYQPQAILWDLGWDPSPHLDDSLASLSSLTEAGFPVVVLLADEGLAAQVWATGPRGLLYRDASAGLLQAALQAVAEGLISLEPLLAEAVFPSRAVSPSPLAEELTPRESEVLQLLADGLTNRAIGQDLGISEHTVKFHVNAILGKLGAQSRTEAVVRASRLGLILL
jgi:DNA-binding NarL/FixJ family response regulator